jgi:hypothetical protein
MKSTSGLKKGRLAVHGVETFGLAAGQRQHAGGHDLQAGPLEARCRSPRSRSW